MSLTAPRDTAERSGLNFVFPVAAATLLYAGALACTDANGRLVTGSDTAGLKTAGRVEATVDNSAGGAGALSAEVKRGVFKFDNSATNPIAQADVGKDAYIEDDATVAKTTVNKIVAGRIVAVDADGVWVDTMRRATPAAVVLTSAQNATAAAVDLPTAQALANALKASYNALQADVAALALALKG